MRPLGALVRRGTEQPFGESREQRAEVGIGQKTEQPEQPLRSASAATEQPSWLYLEPETWNPVERSERRGQRSGKTRTAEQPFNAKGANETQTTQAIFLGRGARRGRWGEAQP